MTDQGEPLRMGGREWALLLALSVLWGGSFFFYKVLAVELPPFTVVLGRVGLQGWQVVTKLPACPAGRADVGAWVLVLTLFS